MPRTAPADSGRQRRPCWRDPGRRSRPDRSHARLGVWGPARRRQLDGTQVTDVPAPDALPPLPAPTPVDPASVPG